MFNSLSSDNFVTVVNIINNGLLPECGICKCF